MSAPITISGQALLGRDLILRPVDIIIDGGRITSIEDNPRAPNLWICPAFFNAHTHLADTIAMDCGSTGDLASLVAPPDGLKHRLLAQATRQDLVRAMGLSLEGMERTGTAGCADFREGGKAGVEALKEAAAGRKFRPVIFGREGGEVLGEGLGISSTRDISDVEIQVAAAKKTGRLIAFHAGERDADDIDTALAYDPDLIVHMTHATAKQLRECADREIPIVVCPRSNWTLGVTASSRHPPIDRMLRLGCTVLLGTDNVMFVPPDMFSEMAFASTLYHLDPREVLRAAIAGSSLTGHDFFIRKGGRATFFTLDPAQSPLIFSCDPLASIVKRAPSSQIRNNVFNL